MRTLAAIRTNRWTEDEERLMATLSPVFGSDLAVVFHNRPRGVVPPLPVVDLRQDFVLGNGLVLVPDWGWRCGDYFYYALRAAYPDYDRYWLIEPDVYFSSPAGGFFDAFRAADQDVLGLALGPFGEAIRFTRGLPGLAHHRAIFALTRLSGRAIDRLLPARQALNVPHVSVRDYPNDEIFAFSTAVADGGLTWGRLEAFAPDWFEGVQFAPDPDLLYEQVAGRVPAGRVLHPVRGLAAFKTALGRRLAGNTGILARMREAVDLLDPQDVEDVAEAAAAQVRGALLAMQQQRAARRRRQAGRA